jgi:peptidoglycan/LPS O-acetylase OafA/YrhL
MAPPFRPASSEQDTAQWGVLNGVRFFLAFVVLTGHISSFVHVHHDWTHAGLWLNQASAVFGFFVIDGFACAQRLDTQPPTYLRWRFYRIYPVYIANLILVLAVYAAIGPGFRYPEGQGLAQPTAVEIIGTLVMLQQFATPFVPLNGQTWSVACYWWLSMVGRRFERLQTLPLVCLMVASYAAFLALEQLRPDGMYVWTSGLACLGAAWIWLSGFMWYRLKGTLKGVLVVLFPSLFAAAAGYFIGIPLLLTLAILIVSGRVKLGASQTRAMVVLGDVAYPLYLSHTAVVAYLCSRGMTNSAVLAVASLSVATLMVYFVDYPARRSFVTFFRSRIALSPQAQ